MKAKLSLLGVVAVVAVLAFVGVLKDVNPTYALYPQPIQPFDPNEVGGLSSTALGATILNHTYTDIIKGERLALPWIYTPPGFSVNLDKHVTDGTKVGSVWTETDVFCNGVVDVLATECTNLTPLDWKERTTAVEGTNEEFLKAMMPPFSWLLRHRADITNLCLGGQGGLPIATTNVLNTVYANVPWSPNQSGFVATTKLGGDPEFPYAGKALCLDSPQNSESTTGVSGAGAIDVYYSPAPEGDSDGPCDTATYACADGAVYGMWTDNIVRLAAGATATKTVTKVKLNNGPEDGTFSEHWEIELTNPTIMNAGWTASPGYAKTLDETVPLTKSEPTTQTKSLYLECKAGQSGEGLVVLKNILWPIPPTKDTYADDNVGHFVMKVVCAGVEGSPLVDKEVIWVKPVAVGSTTLPSTPKHLELLLGETAVVTVDELKANHHTVPVVGHQWLVAEVPNIVGPVEETDISVDWGDSVEVNGVAKSVTPCAAGDACIEFDALEVHGQNDVIADLSIDCPAAIDGGLPGLYSVVIKAIDVPVSIPSVPSATPGESKPSDNATTSVIKVWCWGSEGAHEAAQDDIDDATGLYPRWTAFQNANSFGQGDSRKARTSPPSIASDTNYVERKVDLQCFWIDADGTSGGADNIVQPAESLLDDDFDPTCDSDNDCLIEARCAQPSHPVDELDEPLTGGGSTCPAVPYSEEPNVIVYNKAADQDCDGLVDGIEKAWGSNPQLADSDGDDASDFVEMFQFSNPLNPDTDGDGIKDNPEDDYQAVAVGSAELGEAANYDDNCPGIYNPDQANNDGQRRPNGTKIPEDYASNPTQDKMGDACDTDDDNDFAVDVAEATKGTEPLVFDTDGDRCPDGVEGYLDDGGWNPLVKEDPVCDNLDANDRRFFRACAWNVPDEAEYVSTLWDAEYDGVDDEMEMDPDGDGVSCVTDTDNDNGAAAVGGLPRTTKTEVLDVYEILGYLTMPANVDTDGDGCEDWIEINDVNGDRTVDSGDKLVVAKRAAGKLTGDPVSDNIFDVNKDQVIDSGDKLLVSKNTCGLKNWGGCPLCADE